MIELIRMLIAIVMRAIIRAFSCLTKINENQIIFDSHNGKQYSCNPRAIYEKLITDKKDYKYIWAFNNPAQYRFLENNPNTIVCKYRSFKYLRYFITSKIIISNVYKPAEYPIRSSQKFIQTWHGFPYKTVAMSRGTSVHKWVIKQRNKGTNVFVSCCRHFTETVIPMDFAFKGEILNTGMPRNDILINNKDTNLNQVFKEKIGIDKEKFLVLYAPTYSDTDQSNVEKIDLLSVQKAIEERFDKKVVMAFRGHHLQSKNTEQVGKEIINLDYYPDMQDLLVAADILITDYSSSMWDYSFTGKPCFLYAPDIQEYEKERGFEVSIRESGFPVCETNDELISAIKHYNEIEVAKKVKMHHDIMGSFEKGIASIEVCRFIISTIEGYV